ncbi:MAG: hypothetical protein AAF703_16460 [Cyanobacteria bacterium P01_D01_bin.105]
MPKTKIKTSTREGWAVHVYDSDRHLRFTLESSHIWAFIWGLGAGILIAIVWSALAQAAPSPSADSKDVTNPPPPAGATDIDGTLPESSGLQLFEID